MFYLPTPQTIYRDTDSGSDSATDLDPIELAETAAAVGLTTTTDPVNLGVAFKLTLTTNPTPQSTPGGSTTTTTSNPPTKPKYGDLYTAQKSVWIGGVPSADFSKTMLLSLATPMCTRGLGPKEDMKFYPSRVTDGNQTKFK